MFLKHLLVFISSLVTLLQVTSCARIRPAATGDNGGSIKALPSNDQIPPGMSIENLQLGVDANSRRGRTTPIPIVVKTGAPAAVTDAPPAVPVVDTSDAVLYRLNNQEGRPCILLLTDAIIQFNFKTNLKEDREEDLFVPEKYEGSGNCDAGDDAQFSIKWSTFVWTIFFSKTPGGDHWYVERMTLEASTTDKHFAHINHPPSILHFASKDQGGMMFPTPTGKSFACAEELSVQLTDGDVTAKVLLRKLKMQPFIFKDAFGPEHTCSPGGAKSYRDETAPVAVGSTLAVVSILTVTGYGVYRYMKVKKVQYDTME